MPGNWSMDRHEVEAIAKQELLNHGLTTWSFGWAKTKRRQGVCKYRTRRIEIAEYYAQHNSREKVLDTLMHEIAHALAGPKAGHGPAWKAIARKLGAIPRACDTCPETTVMPGNWQATCEACGRTFHKYRRPQQLDGYRCRCVARKVLTFQYAGDPARKPLDPAPAELSARWEAQCKGCGTIHRRLRRPKTGLWRCRCPHRSELTWKFCSAGEAR